MIRTAYDVIGAVSAIIGIVTGGLTIRGFLRSRRVRSSVPAPPSSEATPRRYVSIASVVFGALAVVSVFGEDPASAGYPGVTVVVFVALYIVLALGLGWYALPSARSHGAVRLAAVWGMGFALVAGPLLLMVNRFGGPPSPVELRVLAGSELTDPKLASILDDLRRETGVTLDLEPIGAVAGSDQIASGTRPDIDAAWFATDEYLRVFGKSPTAVPASKPIMRSPVVIGLKRRVAARLREKYGERLTWHDIATAARRGEVRFAMTDPVKSNSGLAATLAVASAFREGGLRIDDDVVAFLEGFFHGQEVVADTSGFLVDAYRRNQTLLREEDRVDGMVNYESVLLEDFSQSEDLGGDSGGAVEPLEIVYPSDGVVAADYPLVLLSADAHKRAAYERAVDWLLKTDVQRQIADRTARRPVRPGVRLAPGRFPELPGEIEFPQVPTQRALLSRSKDILSQPNRSIFVLDTSGSMDKPDPRGGTRLDQLKAAIKGLTGSDPSIFSGLAGELALFRKRERVIFIPFASEVKRPVSFTLDSAEPAGGAQRDILAYVGALTARGGTATYDALSAAYAAAADAPDRTDIVLLSDGRKTLGRSMHAFLDERPPATRFIPVRAIQFGDASPRELEELADSTHGEVYDATTVSLTRVLRRIRLGR